MLEELREATVAVQGLAGKQLGAELAAQLESTIVSFNDVCSRLLGEYNLKPCITLSAGSYLFIIPQTLGRVTRAACFYGQPSSRRPTRSEHGLIKQLSQRQKSPQAPTKLTLFWSKQR